MGVQQDFSCIASRLDHRFSRQPRPHRVGADDDIGYQSVLPHQRSHPRGIPPATLVQRSLMVIERRVVPARLGVPENQQSLHPQNSLTPSTLSTSTCDVLRLSKNIALGQNGTCTGDSGGPIFHGGVQVSVVSGGDNVCRATSVGPAFSRQEAFDFLSCASVLGDASWVIMCVDSKFEAAKGPK